MEEDSLCTAQQCIEKQCELDIEGLGYCDGEYSPVDDPNTLCVGVATGAVDITNISCNTDDEGCPDTFCDIEKCEYILGEGKTNDNTFCWLDMTFYQSDLNSNYLTLTETCSNSTLRNDINDIPLDDIGLPDFSQDNAITSEFDCCMEACKAQRTLEALCVYETDSF